MNNCIFCKIIKNEITAFKIYENNFVLAFLDISPAANGHTVVIPKKHFNNLSECEDKYLTEIIKSQKIIAKMLYKKLKCLGINYLTNENEIAGQTVFHYHSHIIPKYKKDNGFILKTNHQDLDKVENIYKKIGN